MSRNVRGPWICVLAGLSILMSAAVESAAQSDPAAQYCQQNGGVVQTLVPKYNTNSPHPLQLAGSARFCQFTNPKDQSQITVGLDTLYATLPSLAASAYLFKPPYTPPQNPNVNPAAAYCAQIGGSDQFGGIGGNGGWTPADNARIPANQICVLPDLSMIDSFGILSHTTGSIRGKDLTHIFRYVPPAGQTSLAGQ
jgi:putative hemolysin